MQFKVGSWRRWLFTTAICTSMLNPFGFIHAADFDGSRPGKDRDAATSLKTESPIKHVIILIGENRGLDHTFGVYKPKGRGQTISNILSKGIVNEDGTPGPNFGLAMQFAVSPQPLYYIGAPNSAKTPYGLSNPTPQPNTNGAPSAQSDTSPPFKTAAEASVEPDIQAKNVLLLTTGATGLLDGHPQSSKIDLFEAYVENVLETLEKSPRLKATTAVFITWDEAGGYWDSGFVQPIDYFGDGPRIPLLVLSAYSTGGKIDHGYADHVSLLKFIERNWRLPPLTDRSRDNLPNPIARRSNPYVPTNMPAIADLFEAFDFGSQPNLARYME